MTWSLCSSSPPTSPAEISQGVMWPPGGAFLPHHGCMCVLVTQFCPTLATAWTVAQQAPLSLGLSRQEYWNGLPFPSPGHLPNPGDRTCISCIAGRFSTVWAIREGILKHTVWRPGLTVGPPGLLTNLQWALITAGHFAGCVVWWVELCPLECVAVLTPVPVNATLFENKVFACDQVKMKSWGRALVQSDWLLIKGKFGHRKTSHTGRPPCGN